MKIPNISPILIKPSTNHGKGKLFQVRSAAEQLPYLTELCGKILTDNPGIGLTDLTEKLNDGKLVGCNANEYTAVLPLVVKEVKRGLGQQ